MLKAVEANLIMKRIKSADETLRMVFRKIYSAAANGEDSETVLLEACKVNLYEELLQELGYYTKIVSKEPLCGYVMLDISWKF